MISISNRKVRILFLQLSGIVRPPATSTFQKMETTGMRRSEYYLNSNNASVMVI